MKRLFLAAFLVAFSFAASAQTILTPLTPGHRLPFDTTSRVITSKFTPETEFVRLVCSVSCLVQIGISGTTPVATLGGTTSSIFIPPLIPEYIKVPRNGAVAVIGLTTSGTLYVQEFGR